MILDSIGHLIQEGSINSKIQLASAPRFLAVFTF